ncbi:rod shape-determining protein MreD [Paenibacillus sp. GCM10023252]|uniref:rod shape-determining protein MreD n=1 Tax=Paenibacillus sp. GCM10023252 TaxID=3252649 RepID=UPI00361977C5
MTMNRLVALMVVIFLFESAVMPWLIPVGMGSRIIPHFTFVFIILAALYNGRHAALVLGIAFGFLQDVVFYGHLLGPYAFAMGLIGYLTGLVMSRKRSTMLMAMTIVGLTSLMLDSLIYFINYVFRITSESYVWALLNHMIPSVFLQLAFALICYIPARRWNEGHVKKKPEQESE